MTKQNTKSIKQGPTWIFIGDSKIARIYMRQKVKKLVPIINSGHHNNLKEITDSKVLENLAQ